MITSETMGDPSRFRALADLEAALRDGPPAATDLGRVALIVSRRELGARHTPDRARLTADGGMPDDAWGRKPDPNPEAQLAVIQVDVARLIANGQPLPLFGDNLFLDLDLAAANLPLGSRLRAGAAVLEVTPKAHNGCLKFRDRFGADALRFVSMPALRHRNLRGIYLRVVEDGEVAVGDEVTVLRRGADAEAAGA